jgi:RNA polymerase sigma-70 factor (ECF subfamily)
MSAADRRRFEALALPLGDSLYGAAMRLTRDPAEAEDLVQDSFVRAFRFWDTFDEGSNIKAWMFTILRNTFINGYHRRGRQREFHDSVSSQMRSLGSSVAVANSTSQPPGPEEAVCAAMTQQMIRNALALLPANYRDAVAYVDLDGLSLKEIAEIMDCPIGTIMSRIYRGRKLLHKILHAHAAEIELLSEGASPAGERMTTRGRRPAQAEVIRLAVLLDVTDSKDHDMVLEELTAQLDSLAMAA